MRGFYTIFIAILIINTSIIASADTLYRSANYINNSYTDYVPQSNIDKLAEIENTMSKLWKTMQYRRFLLIKSGNFLVDFKVLYLALVVHS